MALDAELFVGYLRAEFHKSSRLRIILFIVQFMVAVPGALSVLFDSHTALYMLAILGALLLGIYWWVASLYSAAREAAQAGRRSALISNGLGKHLSPAATLSLRERFTVTEDEARRYTQGDYYASKLQPGPGRLCEILEESAFYSEKLQTTSSRTMACIIMLFLVVLAIIAFGLIPQAQGDVLVSGVRIALSLLVFIMSSDVLGAYFAHSSSAKLIRDVRIRLMNLRADEATVGDV